GANKVRQHLVEIGEHALQELALRTRLHRGQGDVAKTAPVLQEQNGKDRNQYQQPDILCHFRDANSRPLGKARDLVAVVSQESFGLRNRAFAPAMLVADLGGDLSRPDVLDQGGRRLAQARGLVSELRTYKE